MKWKFDFMFLTFILEFSLRERSDVRKLVWLKQVYWRLLLHYLSLKQFSNINQSSRGFQYLYLYRNLLVVVVAVVVIIRSKMKSNIIFLADTLLSCLIAANTNTKKHQLVNDNNTTVIVILDIDLHWDSHFNWVYQWRLSYSRFADDEFKYK